MCLQPWKFRDPPRTPYRPTTWNSARRHVTTSPNWNPNQTLPMLLGGTQSPERDTPMDSHTVVQQSWYRMNSRRLTATHLRPITEAIGLPSTGSVDQLCQCIKVTGYRSPTRGRVSLILRMQAGTIFGVSFFAHGRPPTVNS